MFALCLILSQTYYAQNYADIIGLSLVKAPEFDSFIASIIPKDIIKTDNASHETLRLWLEAAAQLAAIVDKIDAREIEEADIIQGIRNALLLLGNTSQQHSLQHWKTIPLQGANGQVDSIRVSVSHRKVLYHQQN